MPRLDEIARLAIPQDNCAIAIRDLPPGTVVRHRGRSFTLAHTVLEGHRFALQALAPGMPLQSWGRPFGTVCRAIAAGDAVLNAGVQEELLRRKLDIRLPPQPNFDNLIKPYELDEAAFRPAAPLPRYTQPGSFMGYARAGGRGSGTRNFIVLLGTSSLVAGHVRRLVQICAQMAAGYAHIDGIVPVAHTEGGHDKPKNRELLLRTLAGFMTHPNVGAAVAVDFGMEAVCNADLRAFMQEQHYPSAALLHEFHSLASDFSVNVAWFKALLDKWLPRVNSTARRPQPLSALKLALQCGGSDAFSGISGNPLAALVAKELIQHGGSANLAETDELIGAEAYVLAKVERLETARKFLAAVERYKEWVGWHGQTAEGNPSGGNKYRGLYNIALKSLGAATKRHPDVALRDVIAYGQPMALPGLTFMDSPGNDLESVAGQVASGCNMIFFVTGNGSITNFPFVPTIKIVTTTGRYEQLQQDMDVNAGAYLDGRPLAELGAQTFALALAVAGGQATRGEQAGHHQVQIWRDWQRSRPGGVRFIERRSVSGQPIPIAPATELPDLELEVWETERGLSSEQVGLILPTSLCSGQIARMMTERMNAAGLGREQGLGRYVSLVHTEGCGGSVVPEYTEMQLGYLQHPKLRHVLLLEHGCEITHNSFFRALLQGRGLDPARFGWASIQMDGGIRAVMDKGLRWFEQQLDTESMPPRARAGWEALRIGIVTRGNVAAHIRVALARLCRCIVAGGGTVILSDKDELLLSPFTRDLQLPAQVQASLHYGQAALEAGFHIMANPRRHWAETLTGLGAGGVELLLAVLGEQALAGHPLVPVLQVSDKRGVDLDATLTAGEDALPALIELLRATMSGERRAQHQIRGTEDFQATRGMLGVSF